MKRFLAAQFAPVLRAWRNGYEAEVRRAAIAFFLLVFLAFGVCLAVPELRLGFSAYLQHLFQGMDLTDGAGNLSPLLLLANNLRACAVTMLYGLIPFVRLPALALGVNAVLLGGLAACYAATDTTMLLYAASLVVSFPVLRDGLNGLRGRPSAETMPALAAVAALLQAITALLTANSYRTTEGLSILTGVAALGLFLALLGSRVMLARFRSLDDSGKVSFRSLSLKTSVLSGSEVRSIWSCCSGAVSRRPSIHPMTACPMLSASSCGLSATRVHPLSSDI